MDFCRAQVTVVGLGLMGGSLAAALKRERSCRRVIGVARRQSTLQTAAMLQFIDEGTTDLREGVSEADIVVLATPVGDILNKVRTIGPWLKPGCLLMDVGSTKKAICDAMAELPDHVQAVGGHPMCGKESSGIAMAEPDLYQDKVFVLTPLQRTTAEALSLAQTLVKAIGARSILLDAEQHDAIVGAISHLPYMLAVTLVNSVEALAGGDDLYWELAASGFRDTSRVAAGSLAMMLDILVTNRGNILRTLYEAQRQLEKLVSTLEQDDWEQLRLLLEAARDRRQEVYR